MSAALALLPLVLVVTLMIGLRWSAAAAGVCGAVAAALVAVLHFGYEGAASVGLALSLLGMLAEATSVALTIVWIVFPALCLHELQLRTGATDTIRRGLAQLSSDRRLIALLVAWFFALLVEGAAGFGTPVALAAPLLVGLGFAPLKAVTLSLIGHSVGVSFGAVGTPVMPQAAASGISPLELAGATALLHAALGWTMAMLVYRLAGDEGDSTHWVWPTLASACFLIPYLAIATWVGPELPTLGGALIGGLVFAWIARRRGLGAEPVSRRELLAAALPYVLLLALILATRLVPPVRALPPRGCRWYSWH